MTRKPSSALEIVSTSDKGGRMSKGGRGFEVSSQRTPVGCGTKRTTTQPVVRTSRW